MQEHVIEIPVLDHGYVRLHNIASMVRRPDDMFDASSIDPAKVARVSFNALLEDREEEKDMKLVNYLQTAAHTTPIEFTTVWLEFKMPLFVARQFDTMRTRSKNEISARYTELPREWYIPEVVRGKPTGGVKQGSGDSVDHDAACNFKKYLQLSSEGAWDDYDVAITEGVAPELARLFLHVNNYTIFAWKQDLHNLCNNFLRLRLDEHAQWETRQYAQAVHDLLSRVLPEWMKLWDEGYQRNKDKDATIARLERELAIFKQNQNNL